jgi:hypothetical protein
VTERAQAVAQAIVTISVTSAGNNTWWYYISGLLTSHDTELLETLLPAMIQSAAFREDVLRPPEPEADGVQLELAAEAELPAPGELTIESVGVKVVSDPLLLLLVNNVNNRAGGR